MDPEWLAAANTAVDLHQDRIDVGTVLSGGSRTQEGTGRPLLSGLSELPPPHGPSQPFRSHLIYLIPRLRLAIVLTQPSPRLLSLNSRA